MTQIINLTPHQIRMTQIINLTPHQIRVQIADNVDVTIPTSGTVARVATAATAAEPVYLGIALVQTQVVTYGKVAGLPEESEDMVYIVSGIVLNALREQGETRLDVVAPATGPSDGVVRDESGQIMAVSKFNALA